MEGQRTDGGSGGQIDRWRVRRTERQMEGQRTDGGSADRWRVRRADRQMEGQADRWTDGGSGG